MYKYICFDLDGTLTQSEFGIIESARYALGKMGIDEPDDKKLLRFIGPPLYVSFEDYYGITGEDAEAAIRFFRDVYETEGYKNAPVFDGMKEVLKELIRSDREIMVVTSKPDMMARRVISHTGLDEYFDTIIGPDGEMKDPGKAKLLQMAIDRLGEENKSKMIMIGDRKYDIEGACEVGIDSIGVLYGYGSEEELRKAGATYIATTTGDILKYV